MTARSAVHKTSESSFLEGMQTNQPQEEALDDPEEAQEGVTAAEAAGGEETGTVSAEPYGNHPHKRFSVTPTA
jgi:hypothetical protein